MIPKIPVHFQVQFICNSIVRSVEPSLLPVQRVWIFKMKVLALLLAIYLIEVNGQFSPFRKIFQKLHEEPPPPVPVFRNNINMNYIEQKLDHFDPNEKRTWQMVSFLKLY